MLGSSARYQHNHSSYQQFDIFLLPNIFNSPQKHVQLYNFTCNQSNYYFKTFQLLFFCSYTCLAFTMIHYSMPDHYEVSTDWLTDTSLCCLAGSTPAFRFGKWSQWNLGKVPNPEGSISEISVPTSAFSKFPEANITTLSDKDWICLHTIYVNYASWENLEKASRLENWPILISSADILTLEKHL